MKQFYKLLMPLVAIAAMALPWTAKAQDLSTYSLSTDTTTYTSIASTTNLLSSVNGDGGTQTVVLPFSFNYGESTFAAGSNLTVRADGYVYFGTSAPGHSCKSAWTSTTSYSLIAPIITYDGKITADDTTSGAYSTVEVDDNGDSVLVIEFKSVKCYYSDYGDYSYQLRLYPDGRISTTYGACTATTNSSMVHNFFLIDGPSSKICLTGSWTAPSAGTPSALPHLSGVPASGTVITYTPPVITCPRPSFTVSNITTTTADLTITPGGSESEWILSVDGGEWENIYSTSYTVTGLASGSMHTFALMAICSADDSSFATTGTCVTECAALSNLPYSNDFENEPAYSAVPYASAFPMCWTRINDASGTSNYYPYVTTTTTYVHNGTKGMYWYHSTSTSYANCLYAVLPPVDLAAYDMSDLTLAFYAKTTSTSYHPQPIVGVMGDPTDTSTFVPVHTFTATDITTNWQLFFVSFADYTDTGAYIAIKWPRTSSTCYLAIDDIFLTDDWCDAPTNVHAVSTPNEVTVSWTPTANAGGYTLVFGTDTITNITDSSYTITDLTSNTMYTYSLFAECSSGNSIAIQGTVRTACGYPELPYMENFDSLTTSTTAATGVHVNCWDFTMLNSSYSSSSYLPQVYHSSSYANSGNYSLRLYGTAYVALPTMSAPVDSLQIMFSHYTTSTSYVMQVGVLEADGSFVPLYTINDPSSTHVDHTFYLDNYTGTSHTIAFYNYSTSTTGYSYHYIDDIVVDYLPTCSPVANVEAEATVGAAVVSWTAGSIGDYVGAYVEYKADTADTWENATTENLSVVLTGLSPETDYTVRVKGICDGDDTTRLWVYATFTTENFGCVYDPDSLIDVTVGAGSTTSTYVPSNSFYNYGYSQQFFTASEIGGSGMITSITLTPSAISQQRTYEIYMGQSSDSAAESFINPDHLTCVYNGGAIPLVANQPVTFNLTTPFAYSDTANLVVIFRDLSGSYVTGNAWKGDNAWTNASCYVYRDASPYTPGSVSGGTASSFRNQITFFGGVCVGTATCAAPAAGIAAVDTTSVTLSWAPGADETSWEVWYRQGSTGAFAVADANITDMNYTVENLNPGTAYYFRVVNICDPDTFYCEVSAMTACAPVDEVVEDFDSYMTGANSAFNPCWYKGNQNQTTNYPYVTNYNNHQCMYFYGYHYSSTERSSWLVLPEMRNDSLNVYELEFEMYRYNNTSANYTSTVLVGAMSDPSNISTFDTIATIVGTVPGQWENYYVSLENYHGTANYICLFAPAVPAPASSGSSYGYNYVYIDNIYAGVRSSCPKPTRFHARDITATTAQLAWDDNMEYAALHVKWGTTNNINAASDSTTVVLGNSCDLSGLTANTTYYCWIYAECADDISRTMSCTFTTGNTCEPVVDLTVADVSTNAAFVTWNDAETTPASSYIFRYKADTATVWNEFNTTNNYYYISGLDSSTTYMVSVVAECNDDSAAAATTSFTTATPGSIGVDEGTYYLPTYPLYNYSISEQLWLENELSSYDSTVNGIYFNAGSAITGRRMKMWVANTTLTDLTSTSFVPSTSMTLVFDSIYNISAGWNYFPFSTPFVRTAGSNLVVLTIDSTGSWESFDGWSATTSPVNSLYGYQDDAAYSTTSLGSLTVEGVRAVMRLDATIHPVNCVAPHAIVASTTDTSITIIWVPGMNETAWSVEYRGLGDTTWTVVSSTQADTFVTVGNLDVATSYVFRIGALCGQETMYTTLRGTTDCGTFSVPFVEDFNVYASGEYDFDPCWYKGNTVNTNMPYIVNVTNVGPDMLMPLGSYVIFPQMDVPVTQLQLRMQYLAARDDIYALVGVCSHPHDILSMTVIDTIWGENVGEVNWVTVPFNTYTTTNDGYIAIYSSYNQSYYDNIHIEMIPQCGVVDSVVASNITTTGATINWIAGNNGASYIVEYGPLGDSVTTTTTSTGTSVVLNGLQSSTTYSVNVYTVCPTMNDTSVATTIRFNTECDVVALPYSVDFEHCNAPSLTLTGILPNCWTYAFLTTNASYTTAAAAPQLYSSTSYAHSGQYSMRMYGQAIALLPEMPVSVDSLMLSFHEYNPSPSSYGLIIGVCDSNTPGFEASFVPVDTLIFSQTNTDVTTYDLASYTGSGRFIGFKNFYINSSSAYSYHYIDDVVVDYMPSCLPPVNVTVLGNTSNSIDLGWTDLRPSTEWQVSYSSQPLTDPSTGNLSIVYTNPTTITGLSDDTTYYFYVRNICTAGDTSIWTSGTMARPGMWVMNANQTDTLTMCGGIIYDDGGATGNYSASQQSYVIVLPSTPGALVTINGTAAIEGNSYDNLYIYDGIGTDGTALVSLAGTSYSGGTTVSATSTAGPLTIYFKSDGSVQYSGFELAVSCLIDPCGISNVHVVENSVTTTSLQLQWDGTATSYQVEYGPAGFAEGTGTTISTTTNSAIVSGLSAMSNYEFHVRGLCGDTGFWHNVLYTMPMCDNETEVLSYDSTWSTTTTNYAPIGYSLYNYGYVQTIIDSARFAGLQSEITAFAFKSDNATSGDQYENMTVWMANIPESTFSSSAITPDNNHVFVKVINNASFSYSDAGWHMHSFDSTFTWDGHSNVLVSVKRDHGDWSGSASFNAHNTTGAKTRYYYQDSGPISHTSPSASSSGNQNLVADMIFYSCGAACAMPIPTVTHDYQSATLTVAASGMSYELSYGTDPSTLGNPMTSTTGVFNITGLTPATQYFFAIRQQCDTNLWSANYESSFTTDSLPCLAVSDITVGETGYTSVTLSWTSNSNETAWEVMVYNTVDTFTYVASATTYTANGLTPSVTYNANVRPLCGSNHNIEGDWVETPVSFTTRTCQPVTGVTVVEVTNTTATIAWTAATEGTGSYRLEYGPNGMAQGQGTSVTATTNSYTIEGLEPDLSYDVYVANICSDNIISAWSSVTTFQTTNGEGIADVDAEGNLSIYPNPASSMVTLTVAEMLSGAEVTIVDLNGRTVMTFSLQGTTATFDVSQLSQGAYFVRLTGEQATTVRKLIVK